jgi:hypothetical protein
MYIIVQKKKSCPKSILRTSAVGLHQRLISELLSRSFGFQPSTFKRAAGIQHLLISCPWNNFYA